MFWQNITDHIFWAQYGPCRYVKHAGFLWIVVHPPIRGPHFKKIRTAVLVKLTD